MFNHLADTQSEIVYTHELQTYNIHNFKPSIIYLVDCDCARPHFDVAIEYAEVYDIPKVLISNDLFHYNLVVNHPNTKFLDGIISTVTMKRLMDQYRNDLGIFVSSIKNPFVNTNQFNVWGSEKLYDICIYGRIDFDLPPLGDFIEGVSQLPPFPFYPLRKRLYQLLVGNDKYRVKHIPTPQRACWNCPVKGKELSEIINQSILTVSTSSRCDRCMQKYFEISASNSMVLGNIPTDYRELFEGNVVEVTMKMTDTEIFATIDTALSHKQNTIKRQTILVRIFVDTMD